MIDEKRLSELGKDAFKVLVLRCALQIREDALPTDGSIDYDEWNELLRLARLGLWAEQHGIPALSGISKYAGHVTRCEPNLNCRGGCDQARGADKALASLPKEPRDG